MSNKSVAEIHLNSTKHGLDGETRQSVVELLNARLADVIDHELQAKQAHWNVKGPNFIGLHELFDEVSASAAKYKDEIAERAVMLGGVADRSLHHFLLGLADNLGSAFPVERARSFDRHRTSSGD